MIDYGLTQYKKLNPKGLCILIEKMTENDLRKNGEIYIPNTAKLENYKIGVGKILDLSRKAKNETNLSKMIMYYMIIIQHMMIIQKIY